MTTINTEEQPEKLQPSERTLFRCLAQAAQAIMEGKYVGPDELVCYMLPALAERIRDDPGLVNYYLMKAREEMGDDDETL